jgi:hypothetical protein
MNILRALEAYLGSDGDPPPRQFRAAAPIAAVVGSRGSDLDEVPE